MRHFHTMAIARVSVYRSDAYVTLPGLSNHIITTFGFGQCGERAGPKTERVSVIAQ
ncbi:MAG: hypothetical protein HYY11_08410 [Candidatus Methylomirabilis oxyfera]|nr:hypothetical protein [Candidatus Methylomirabilis oxyfera]